MKSWRFHAFGSLDHMTLDDVPVPEPAPGEALVKIEYAALNPADHFLIKGQYPRAGKPPFAVGRDGSGTIAKTLPGSAFQVGDRVIVLRGEVGVSREGTLSEYVAVPEESLARLPQGWSGKEGAAGPLVHLTAWQALVDEGHLAEGETVLITGASGGVGTAALDLAKSMGARVVALSRSAEKREKLKQLGADIVLDSEDPDLIRTAQAEMAKTGNPRADVVVENLAGPFLQKSINMTGSKGRICVVGLLAGLKSEVEIGTFLFKRIHIIGVAVGNYTTPEVRAAWEGIVATLNKSGRRPIVDRVFPVGEAKEAFTHMDRGPMGKVLVGPW